MIPELILDSLRGKYKDYYKNNPMFCSLFEKIKSLLIQAADEGKYIISYDFNDEEREFYRPIVVFLTDLGFSIFKGEHGINISGWTSY